MFDCRTRGFKIYVTIYTQIKLQYRSSSVKKKSRILNQSEQATVFALGHNDKNIMQIWYDLVCVKFTEERIISSLAGKEKNYNRRCIFTETQLFIEVD